MTDEELNKYANSIYLEPSSFEYFKKQISEAVEKGSIEFSLWANENGWHLFDVGKIQTPESIWMWRKPNQPSNMFTTFPVYESKTPEELYKLYLQDQNKK